MVLRSSEFLGESDEKPGASKTLVTTLLSISLTVFFVISDLRFFHFVVGRFRVVYRVQGELIEVATVLGKRENSRKNSRVRAGKTEDLPPVLSPARS